MQKVIALLADYRNKRKAVLDEFNWEKNARPSQMMPSGQWRVWLILAGRGFGKTRTGAETVRKWVMEQGYRRIALVAETENDARQVMIEGESGLLNVHPPHERPSYEPSRRLLVWPNGAIATCYSAENSRQLRGPQFDGAWIDELAKFRQPREIWDQLNMGLRLGSQPRVVITTTPRPVGLLELLLKTGSPEVIVTRGSTYENASNLSPDFIRYIRENHEGSLFGRQEIHGEIVQISPDALWTRDMIERAYVCEVPDLARIVVAIDPAVSNHGGSDETGIVVAGMDMQSRAYILDDLSGKFTCENWARRAVDAFHKYKADRIVAEVNKGGDLVREMLRAIDHRIPFSGLHATRNKIIRAEPVAALYQQNRIFHVKAFPELELQLSTYTGEARGKSPDRMDALVWAVTELLLGKDTGTPTFRCWTVDPAWKI